MKSAEDSIDIDSFWEYADPASSEWRFRARLSSAQGDERLELLTQIGRTYGLRQRIDEAHQILDQVEAELINAGPRPHIRYLLERGRTYNSSGEGEKARTLFVEAWERSVATHHEGLAVDAAHMLAITYSGKPEAIDWNRRGLGLARGSEDPKALALVPAMLNNTPGICMTWDASPRPCPCFRKHSKRGWNVANQTKSWLPGRRSRNVFDPLAGMPSLLRS